MDMKKEYSSPLIELTHMNMESLLSGSGVNGNVANENVIDYGGIDDEGVKDPSALQNSDIWEDEEVE